MGTCSGKKTSPNLKKAYIEEWIMGVPMVSREAHGDRAVRKKLALYWEGEDENDKHIPLGEWKAIKKQLYSPHSFVESKRPSVWRTMHIYLDEYHPSPRSRSPSRSRSRSWSWSKNRVSEQTAEDIVDEDDWF
jgi:hypothetical protein